MLNPLSRSSVSSIKTRRTFSRASWLLAVLILAMSVEWLSKAGAQNPPAGQTPTTALEIATLEVGNPIERELAGGQRHSYQSAFTKGQYLKLAVEQRGVMTVSSVALTLLSKCSTRTPPVSAIRLPYIRHASCA